MNETNTTREQIQTAQRRQFLTRTGAGMGAAALNCLTTPALFGSGHGGPDDSSIATTAGPQFPGKAKRIIYLFMCGGPSQIDTFDYKPELEKLHGTELPASIRGTQRITGMTAGQTTFPVVKAQWKYQQHGQCGAWVSDAFPQMASIVDELAYWWFDHYSSQPLFYHIHILYKMIFLSIATILPWYQEHIQWEFLLHISLNHNPLI